MASIKTQGSRQTSATFKPQETREADFRQKLDAYLKFIEADFIGSKRIDPCTDGWPDQRPTVREELTQLGDLLNVLDFSQTPNAPLLLPLYPARPGSFGD